MAVGVVLRSAACLAAPALRDAGEPSTSSSQTSFRQASGYKKRTSCPSQRLVCRASNVQSALVNRPGIGGGGGAVLDKPTLDRSWLEKLFQTEEGGEGARDKDRKGSGGGDKYRVLLVDSDRHTEQKVVKVLPTVIPSLTAEQARACFQESRQIGVGVVTVCVKEVAEFYMQMMQRSGLKSTIEPDSDTI